MENNIPQCEIDSERQRKYKLNTKFIRLFFLILPACIKTKFFIKFDCFPNKQYQTELQSKGISNPKK